MLVQRILEVILPVYAIVAVGYVYARKWQPDMEAANRLNTDVFVPALVFHALSTLELPLATYYPLLGGAAILVVGSGLLAWPIARQLGLSAKTFVPPMMFNNAGNIGVPLAVLAFGERALPAAILLLVLQTLMHFSVGIRILNRDAPLSALLRTPALIATAAGLACSTFDITIPQPLSLAVEMLGNIAVPLMLLALGVRLVDADFRDWRTGLLGALLRPLLGILLFLLVVPWLPLTELDRAMLLLFGALPPAVMNFIFAERYGQEPAKVASIVMLGNLVGMFTLAGALVFALDWTA